MEFIFAGIFIIMSSILLGKYRSISNGDMPNKYTGEYYGMLFIGAVLIFFGAIGFAMGVDVKKTTGREFVTLFFLAFILNVQARILNYMSLCNGNVDAVRGG